MAGENRAAAAALSNDLLRDGRSYDFFQAIRLLRLVCEIEGFHQTVPGGARSDAYPLRFQPSLSLAFPESDLERIERLPATGAYRLAPNFLALYGVSSPLPTFYSEDIINEAREERSGVREFLDIIHNAFYPLLYLTWSRYRSTVRLVEERGSGFEDELSLLIGLGERSLRQEIPKTIGMLRYLGLFSQCPRSGLGLKTLLSDFLGGVPVEVEMCQPRRSEIPSDQRMVLGAQRMGLGEDQYLGSEVDDRMGTVLIRIGPIPRPLFSALLPGATRHREFAFMVAFYLVTPVRCEVDLILAAGDAQPLMLGSEDPAKLGLDTWLLAQDYERGVEARFEL